MATYTSHLNLKLPDYSDTADIKDLNDNFKKIDDAIASGSSGGGTGGGIVTETDPTVPSWAKQPQKPTYTAAEVGALPNTTVIPTVPSALPNPQPIVINGISYDGSERKEITVQAGDGGSITETDPTVPAWAKAEKKPSYTAEEVGALPSTYEPPVKSVNGKTGAVALVASDVGALPNTTVIPTVPTALKNPYPLTINGVAYDGSEAKTVTIESTGGGASVELDTTLTQYNKAADAGAVGNALAQETAAREEAVNELKEAVDDKLDASELPTAINTALAQAKESGQFDGAPGKDGKDGADGAPGAKGDPGDDYVLTEADKEEIAEMAAEKVEVPEGGGGSYTLPIASPDVLGGVKPAAKTDGMTQEIGVDEEGKLWGAPGGGGGELVKLLDVTLEEEASSVAQNYKWTEVEQKMKAKLKSLYLYYNLKATSDETITEQKSVTPYLGANEFSKSWVATLASGKAPKFGETGDWFFGHYIFRPFMNGEKREEIDGKDAMSVMYVTKSAQYGNPTTGTSIYSSNKLNSFNEITFETPGLFGVGSRFVAFAEFYE